MHDTDEAADRRFWTAYDHFRIEQEARALRREAIYASGSKLWQHVRAALARAGAQPVKSSRTAGA